MGLPIFREPVVAQERAVAAKADPTAPRRSTIRRQRTIRSPRRQEEVHFFSSSRLPSHRSDDRHHGPRLSSRYINSSRLSHPRDQQSQVPSAYPQHHSALPAINGAGNLSIHLSDAAWREAVGRMSAPEQQWESNPAAPNNLGAAPGPNISSSRPLMSGFMSSYGENSGNVARPRSRRGPPEDITRDALAVGVQRRRMERDRQTTQDLRDVEGRERRYNDILNGVPVPSLQASFSDQAYRREMESLPRLSRISAHDSEGPWRARPGVWSSSHDAQRSSRLPVWPSEFDEVDDDHWEHMLSTITPDPHLPSHDSSFTSAAATGGSGAAANSADSFTTPLTAPSIGDDELAQDDCEDGHDDEHAYHNHDDSDSGSHSESLDDHQGSLVPPFAPIPPEMPSFEHFLGAHPPILASSSTSGGHAIIRITASPLPRARSASPLTRPRSASPSAATTAPTRLHASSRHYRLPSPPVNSFGYMVQASLRPDHLRSSRSRSRSDRDSPHAAEPFHRASSHLSEVIIPGTADHPPATSDMDTAVDNVSGRRRRDGARPESPQLPSLGTLRSSLAYHARQYERRHQPNVHDEDAAAERDRMREVLESLVRRGDLGDEWWGSIGLDRRPQ